jgi:hypothetical protein
MDRIVRRTVIAVTPLLMDLCLLLSAYSPLFLIGAIRADDDLLRNWLLGLGIGFTLLVLVPITGARSRSARPFRIAEVQSASGEVAAYVATYILPLLVVGDKKPRDLVAYAVCLAVIGVIFVRGRLLHYNPWVFLFLYRVFSVRVGDRGYYLVAKDEPRPGQTINAKLFANRFMLM